MSTGSLGLIDRDPHQAYFQAILDSLGEAIFVQDAADARILYINDTACRMFGHSRDVLMRLDMGNLSAGSPPYSQQDALMWLAKARQTGLPQVVEWLARHRSGDLFWVEITVRLVRMEQGERFVVTARDIRDRKQVAANAQINAQRLRHLMDRVPGVAIQGYRKDGTVIYWNQASERLYGFAEAEAVGRNLLDLIIPAEMREGVRAVVQSMMETGIEHPPGEISLLRKDGSRVSVYSSHVVLQWPGQEPEFFCLDMDMTELHRLEQERLEMERQLLHTQKLESLGVLAGGIAHDFNNLLTAMMGNMDLALRDLAVTSAAYVCVKDALAAVRRAADLTRQMLAYSGKGRFILQDVNLSELVEENASMLRTAISKSASLNLRLAPNLPTVHGDLGQLQQVVMNLMTNASEALAEKPGSISLATGVMDMTVEQLQGNRADNQTPPGRYVFLEVKDDGVGMDKATLNRLFDPFFTTKRAGRGLGLSAVLGIMRGHAGVILVDAAPGKGACFRVAFPVQTARPVLAPAVEPPTTPRLSLQGGQVLLVDDEPGIRLLGQRILDRLGVQVVLAADGLEALDLARLHARSLACVVVDMTMPKLDGLGCLRALKQEFPGLPIILSSGYAQEDVTRRLGDLVPDGFVSKPYEADLLEQEIARVVAQARATSNRS